MYVCRVRVAACVRTLSFSFFSFLRRSSSLEEELELLSLSLELEPGIRAGLRTSAGVAVARGGAPCWRH